MGLTMMGEQIAGAQAAIFVKRCHCTPRIVTGPVIACVTGIFDDQDQLQVIVRIDRRAQ
ncbi:MAG: hypothetical protein O3A97_03990 [Proteobacteria bacterium]|nr:hypothetical protein [Pseudomonadota bacterium]